MRRAAARPSPSTRRGPNQRRAFIRTKPPHPNPGPLRGDVARSGGFQTSAQSCKPWQLPCSGSACDFSCLDASVSHLKNEDNYTLSPPQTPTRKKTSRLRLPSSPGGKGRKGILYPGAGSGPQAADLGESNSGACESHGDTRRQSVDPRRLGASRWRQPLPAATPLSQPILQLRTAKREPRAPQRLRRPLRAWAKGDAGDGGWFDVQGAPGPPWLEASRFVPLRASCTMRMTTFPIAFGNRKLLDRAVLVTQCPGQGGSEPTWDPRGATHGAMAALEVSSSA